MNDPLPLSSNTSPAAAGVNETGSFFTRREAAVKAGLRHDQATNADGLVRRIVPLFVTIADRSGVAYDREIAGINLADALAYRLPRASSAARQIRPAPRLRGRR